MDIEATTARDGSAIVTIDGTPQKITATTLEDVGAQVVDRPGARSHRRRKRCSHRASDPDGTGSAHRHPDGDLHDPAEAASPPRRPRSTTAQPPASPARTPRHTLPRVRPDQLHRAPARRQQVQVSDHSSKATEIEQPATQGWRGVRHPARAAHEPEPAGARAERDDIHAVSQHWPGPGRSSWPTGRAGQAKPALRTFGGGHGGELAGGESEHAEPVVVAVAEAAARRRCSSMIPFTAPQCRR